MQVLKNYLVEAKAFNTPSIRALVFGNPSVDMDSVIGSLGMSWYYGSGAGGEEAKDGGGKLMYSPVINCSKENLYLRFDIIHNLHKHGIDDDFIAQNFFFVD